MATLRELQKVFESGVAGSDQDDITTHMPHALAKLYTLASIEPGFFVTPHSDIIVVEQEVEQYSRGGILQLEDESKRMHYGTIKACGPGRVWDGFFVPMGFKVGQRVVWGKYASGGEPIKHEGREYILLREGDIVGVMNVAANQPAKPLAA